MEHFAGKYKSCFDTKWPQFSMPFYLAFDHIFHDTNENSYLGNYGFLFRALNTDSDIGRVATISIFEFLTLKCIVRTWLQV